MRKILFVFVLVMSGLWLNGCVSQPLEQSTEPVCFPNTLPDQAMDAAETALTKMHFDIEKSDPDVLYIRTRPLSGAQFFEFWRKDNASSYAKAESNLHSVRRTAELTFTPDGTTTCVQCQVHVQRLSIPEAPLVSASQMGGVHTKSHTRFQTLKVDAERKAMSQWVDAGPDPDLEQRILQYIQREIDRGTAR